VIIGASGGGSSFLFIIVIGFLLIYLLFVRPQKRRQNQQQQMTNDIRLGDEVLTAGGIYGTVTQVEDDQVTVEIAPKTEVRIARRAIAGVTREPEEDETEESDVTEESNETEESHEDEGSGPVTSNEENRG
jgi:preprotein translocase subunit YajC